MLHILKLMRLHQYIKNFFIFLPLFFALKITDLTLVVQTVIAFVAFCLTASAVYILNDLNDLKEDKLHPLKKNRPLASGKITKFYAFMIMITLLIVGFVIMWSVSLEASFILVFYVLINIFYSLHLKHVAIVDIMIIAIGFVLRIFVGAMATDIHLSMWIVIMTFLLALFMALAKRRDDVLIYLDTGKKMRKVIDGYNLQFLDTAMAIMASVVIVAYIIYTTSTEVLEKFHSEYLYLTAIFVILGIMRYLQIAFVYHDSGSPTRIVLKDHFIQSTIFAWIITFAWILY